MALAVVFPWGCILMDALVTNVASAVFMFPIAMTIAKGLDVSFMPFVITVMVGGVPAVSSRPSATRRT